MEGLSHADLPHAIRTKEPMSLQPRRPLIDTLRDVLRKMEADAETDTPNLVELKRIIRERIAAIEGNSLRTSNPVPFDPPLASHPHCDSAHTEVGSVRS